MADLSIGAEDLLSTVGESVGLIVMLWEFEQRKIFASEQWSVLVGGPAGTRSMEPEQMATFIHPDDAPALEQAIVRCLKGEDIFYDAEIRVRSHSNEWHWLTARGRVVLRDAQHRATRMVATFIDAGRRKLMEQALADSEARYRASFDVSLEGILLTTPEGQILSANPAACRLFGLSESELLQAGVSGLHKVADTRLTQLLQQCTNNQHSSGDAVVRRSDGAAIEVESSLALFSERSGAPRISIQLQDVSHARQIERRLQRLTKLYDARSRCNRAIIDSTTREDLFRAVCQIVVDCGDFGLVWIALTNQDSLKVGAAFASGIQLDYLREAHISLDPTDDHGRGPLARAVRQGEPVISNDFLNEIGRAHV